MTFSLSPFVNKHVSISKDSFTTNSYNSIERMVI